MSRVVTGLTDKEGQVAKLNIDLASSSAKMLRDGDHNHSIETEIRNTGLNALRRAESILTGNVTYEER